MRKPAPALASILALALVVLAGCQHHTTVSTPSAPQVTVAGYVNVLTKSLDFAYTDVTAAYSAGAISPATLNAYFAVIRAATLACQQINAEVVSGDAWEVQRVKIRGVVVAAGLDYLVAQLPPQAKILVQDAVAAFNNVSTAVGGPTI